MECFTIAEAARLIRDKSISPTELTRSCLARIERLDPTLHAFITVTEESALAQAREAEAEIMARGQRGPLHGIPVALKDIFDVGGVRTTAHSRHLIDNIAAGDSAAAQRLRAAGTVMLGKLALHEFAFAGPSFDLPWPPARNPWNPRHFTGGSSSGTAAAIAAGMILGGPGSDSGGSIRGPAALCGIAGLKPTYGRVSSYGMLPTAFSLDHVGPMAWTVEDCAILLQALAGYDCRDPASADVPVGDYTTGIDDGIRGVRIGVVRSFLAGDGAVSEATRSAIETALGVLRDLGAELREISLSPLADWKAAGLLVLLAEAHVIHEQRLRLHPERYGELARDQLTLGALISAADYIQAARRRRELTQEMAEAMAGVDVLVCATQGGEAPPIDEVPKWRSFAAPSHTMPFSVSGYPALTLCCGFGAGGLPLALQIGARPFDEATLLRVGHSYERATPWRARRPDIAA